LSPPSPPPGIPFSQFFRSMIEALAKTGLRFSILRNYEGFPHSNSGRDIDFLIDPADLRKAIHTLQSLPGVRIVGYLERPSVAMVYLEGVRTTAGARCLEVDFDLSLSWKGLPFLPLSAVLEHAMPRHRGGVSFNIPAAEHEAVISLLASLLVGGWVPEKYFPKAQQAFAADEAKVMAALTPQFGFNAAKQLVDAVVEGSRCKVFGSIPSLRLALAVRSFWRRPLRSLLAVVRHYAAEFVLRFSARSLATVGLAGGGRDTRSSIAASLLPMLRDAAAVVEKHDGLEGSNLHRKSSPPDSELVSDPSNADSVPRGVLLSMTSAAILLAGEWIALLRSRRNLTLRISDSDFQDMLINPQDYCYAGPRWFARLIGKLMPSKSFWISVDRPTPPMHAEIVHAAILDGLAERTSRVLKSRFQQRKPSN